MAAFFCWQGIGGVEKGVPGNGTPFLRRLLLFLARFDEKDDRDDEADE
ncbi:MAG: hypothetical protein ACXVPK_12010 [Tumebacillaceae bacterium]